MTGPPPETLPNGRRKKLFEAGRRSIWAFTPATFGALLGQVEPNYLKLMMKRLTDQGVLIRAARGVYVNPQARSLPSDVRRGLIRFLRPREISYISLESKLSEAGAISQITTALTCMTTGSPRHLRDAMGYRRIHSHGSRHRHRERRLPAGRRLARSYRRPGRSRPAPRRQKRRSHRSRNACRCRRRGENP